MSNKEIIAVRSNKEIYRKDNLVVKIFENTFKKSDILNEALNHARVEETGLSIPKIIEVRKIDEKWAIISEFIEGKTLAQMMVENPEEKNRYLEQFVDIQLEMHTKRSPLLNKLKYKMKRKISETTLDDTVKYELHTRLESMPIHDKVCHGDYNPSNVIISNEGKAYIMDWSHATQGNASADAAITYLLFKLEGKNDEAEKYLDLFCDKSKTEKKYVRKWMPIVAASQSLKGNPEEREFLLHWANVVDYY